MDDIRLLVGIPAMNMEVMPRDFFDSVLMMQKPEGTEVFTKRGHAIDEVRNAFALQALNGGYTHLLMLDADMFYPVDTIDRLLKDDVDIVCGLACQRIAPYDFVCSLTRPADDEWAVCMANEAEIPESGTYETGSVGGAALLIRTDVFRKMEYPFFSREQKNRKGETVSEDIYFSLKARAIGFQCHTNMNVRIGHLMNVMVLPVWNAKERRWERVMANTTVKV